MTMAKVGKKYISNESKAILDKFAASLDDAPCPYCTSDNPAIRETYFDQNCVGCVKRMGTVDGGSERG